jgi:predicted  nucleic acid-binding Zn-ribbon protein
MQEDWQGVSARLAGLSIEFPRERVYHRSRNKVMDKEQTKEFPDARSFEDRVLSELASIRSDMAARFTGLEERLAIVEQRLESVEQRLESVEQRLESVEQRLDSVERRLIALEDRVDARLRETRPIWEAVQADIHRLDEKFDNVIRDLYDVRTKNGLLEKRLLDLERRLNP